ncbi:hypothetical protein, partial [Burkholderia ubonensis]|uniref:hypothetical protein n=1 Tax=Burkholderia ubonensis TaxID=101571 RepID=UPI000A91C9FB
MKQQRFLFPDEADAIAYWSDKEIKIWAVDIAAGPERRPTYRHTYYARARTADRAIECVKRNLLRRVPGARYRARLLRFTKSMTTDSLPTRYTVITLNGD